MGATAVESGAASRAAPGAGKAYRGGAGDGDRGAPPSFVVGLVPGTRIPVREQIIVQLVTALRAGRLHPGDRLPSVRALARRLAVHRNTVGAAYRQAAARGLVELRPGSGAYVAAPPREADPLPSLVARERAAGAPYAAVRDLLERWRDVVAARHVTVVGPGDAQVEVWRRELGVRLSPAGVRVSGLTREAAARAPGRLRRSVVAATGHTLAALDPVLPPWAETVLLRPGPPRRLPCLLEALPRGSVLAVATGARRIVAEVRALSVSLRGEEVAVVRVDAPDGTAAARALDVARFVLADVVAGERLRGRVEGRRIRTLRHLPRSTGRDLARAFGAPGPRERRPGEEGRQSIQRGAETP